MASLFRVTTSLREHAFWRVVYDTAAPVDEILALDAGRLELTAHRSRGGSPDSAGHPLHWRADTSQLLRLLLAGRTFGPVFLTSRRAPDRAAAADICPVTGQARRSYRRAAEIFTTATRPLARQASLAAADAGNPAG